MESIFDLEQDILNTWKVVDDIDLLYKEVMETDMSPDEISNFLLGLKTIYEVKFQKLLKTYSEHYNEYDELRKQNIPNFDRLAKENPTDLAGRPIGEAYRAGPPKESNNLNQEMFDKLAREAGY